MGVVGSKSPLERRNTVLRRSQRKSVHGIKSKAEKIAKDIKKFKGTEENVAYVELKAKIENAERDLRVHTKNLQPQIRHVHNETLKKLQECHTLLEDKLRENQEKAVAEPKKECRRNRNRTTERRRTTTTSSSRRFSTSRHRSRQRSARRWS
jgi:hypothetical protein